MINKAGIVILILFALTGLYFGFSGICKLHLEEEINKLDEKRDELQKVQINRSVDDLPPFTNKYDYEYYMKVSRYEKIFPLVKVIPSFFGLIMTAMFFGLLGSIARIILGIVRNEYSKVNQIKFISEPLLGLFTGLCVLGISYVLPTILVFNGDAIRPITLMFFSLFCGIYASNFFEKLAKLFSKFFK